MFHYTGLPRLVMNKQYNLSDPFVNYKESESCRYDTCSLYYKHITILNDDSRVFNKLETSLTDNAKVIIYDCHMFIVQATGACTIS